MIEKEPELAIRFLRQGFVPVSKKPDGFDKMSEDEKKAWAYTVLESLNDKELFAAMSDFKNPEINGHFDSAPDVEAIQNPQDHDTPNESIFSTTAWDAYIDPEYGENIVNENKNFANFIEGLGFTKDELSYIAIQAKIPQPTKLETLKLLDNAHSKALEAFRQEHGVQLIEKIKNDNEAPQILKELIDAQKFTYMGFEKITTSLDYMPDHCVYIYLSGEILLGFRTKEQSDSFIECDYEYGDLEVREEMYFDDVINSNNLIPRNASTKESAEAHKYLLNKLTELDNEIFRDYLLEREV